MARRANVMRLLGLLGAMVNAALGEGMREPGVVARLTSLGFEPVATTPEEFAKYIEGDVSRNSALLRAINFDQ